MILGVWFFLTFLHEVFLAATRHFRANFFTSFSPLLFLSIFLPALTADLNLQPPPNLRFNFIAVVTPQVTAFSFKDESFALTLSHALFSKT
jgi:hypothetical protein